MKKAIKIILTVLICFVLIIGAATGIIFVTYKSTVSFDFSKKTGEVMKGASGYLYGIAENGVPSAEMVESVDVTTIAQKVAGGLQHPIGDIDNASPMLTKAKYEVVYLQDIYDTWYYMHDEIMQMRSENAYDWQEFLTSDYLPKVEKMTKELMQKPYSDKLVYCLYNECDNGIWFGESVKDENPDNAYGVWCDYNQTGRDNFNSAWKQTYDLVKSINPKAVIGGPGFCDYNYEEIKYFLEYCKENACLPDVMIYHELSEDTVYFFDEHIREYRQLEKDTGIDALPIIITEYGMMNENGYPGEMVKIITQFETNKVYGDNAYWRLADNLNDTCADDNSPNAQWWLMRWYTDMKGQTVEGKNKDILSSNFKNYFKYHLDELSFKGFMGIASVSDEGDEIDIVCGGGDRESRVQLKHLDKTSLYGKEVRITVEESVYKGLYGIVSSPVVIKEYTEKLGKSLTVDLGKLDRANAYHVVVKEASGEDAFYENEDGTVSEDFENKYIPVRYEFENGTLLGSAYTYDSYCPASGGNEEGHDTVGGMENEGDGVEITIDVPSDGTYNLDFVYGNSNDGEWDENGRQSPDGRVYTEALLTVDGEEEHIFLPNTIRSEYSSCYTVKKKLSKGTHTVSVRHVEGTYVLDSLVVSPEDTSPNLTVLPDEDRSNGENTSFLAVADKDGYYDVQALTDADTLTVGSAKIPLDGDIKTVFFKRGLNYLDFNSEKTLKPNVIENEEAKLSFASPDTAVLAGSADVKEIDINGEKCSYIDGISCNSGGAKFSVNADKSGDYCITLDYSNNEEGGVHDYNVDLVERYVTVDVNGVKAGNYYCRNTYSWETRKTVTFTVELKEGINTITIRNDGEAKFNGRDTFAPYIFGISVNPLIK